MTKKRKRELMLPRGAFAGTDPLARTDGIRGVRVYRVGQGDSIAIVDEGAGRVVLQIDYGGKTENPFSGLPTGRQATAVDEMMPVDPEHIIMLSHWDLDHWCSASKGTQAKAATWLVPRQVTSPSAVEFVNALPKVHCIPESLVNEPRCFVAQNGDELWWEKIGASQDSPSKSEDCNLTGVAFSLVRRKNGSGQAILLPGDAPFDKVPHYHRHLADELTLTGIVAFHHGSATHWTEATRAMLRGWPRTSATVQVIFSVARNSGYKRMPSPEKYEALFGSNAFAPSYTYAQPLSSPCCEIHFA